MNKVFDILSNIFSINNFSDERLLIKFFGLKIKFKKREFVKKVKKSPYFYYKKNNIDITTIPPAEGDIRNKQLVVLYLLKQLDLVCKKHNIQYWLDFGTLMGAVRHKGYIPWDDDIDIGIMRKDYNKLIEVFDSSVEDKDLYIELRGTKKCSLFKIFHKKINHIFIDIFPYDFYNKKLTRDEQISMTAQYKNMRSKFLKSQITVDLNELQLAYQNLTKDFTSLDKQEPYVIWGFEFGHNWKKWIHDYDTIFPLKNLEFEGEKFPCVNNYDKYLTDIYGNYMAYPKNISVGHFLYKKFEPEEEILVKQLIKKIKNKRVITYGTFDILHYGHINLLKRAKALGDYLIVVLSSDEFNAIKNKTSYYTYEQRKMILEACRYVDLVVPEYNWEQKISDVQKYKADVFVMGNDWEGKFDFLKDYCEVVYLPRTPDVSTTQVKTFISQQ